MYYLALYTFLFCESSRKPLKIKIFNYLEVGEAALAGCPADAPEAQGGQVQAAPRCSQSAQAVLPLLQD